ncbi:LOW QUALITY PROTEIN: beta-1,4-glucuronyltransferase 1 [Acridotheres tristis]
MGRGRFLGGCAWLLGGLALLQTLYLRALPPPRPLRPRRPPRGVLDTSGAFRVYWDVLGTPPGWARDPRPELVLATHGSPGRAAAALGGPWGGPLSVAVFGAPPGGLQELMAILGGPCRSLRGRLRLHVVLGAAGPPPKILDPPRAPQNSGGCRGALARLAAADPPSYSLEVPYPGNLLRNVAWQGAAGGGLGGGPPPKLGTRFVLMVDADVVPSPGLREGFLELLRNGGLHPKNWEGQGGLHPENWGGREGLSDPKAPDAQKDLGNPKSSDIQGTLGFRGDLGDPKDLGAPDGLRVLNTLGVPGFPKVLGISRSFGDPNGLSDPSVPSAMGVPKGLQDLSDPNVLEVPHTPSDPVTAEPPWARVLFVLPAFEVRSGLRLPRSKAELLRFWGAGEARPFYGTLCPRCQAPTDFGRWRALPPPPRLRVAYEVPWRDPWEPFFVAPARGVPPFDERFLQYGFNRISQACELHVAGFRFAVLDGAFVTHRGFKEPGGFHRGREAELGQNRRLFRRFREELRERYPGSTRRC